MNQLEKNSLVSGLKVALTYAEQLPVTKDCVSCYYADRGGVAIICKKAGVVPPAHVQREGCEGYAFDSTSPPF